MNPTTTLVIFGASGDLTRRKLIPALFELHRKGRLPEGFRLLGAARSPATDDTFREQSRQGLQTFAPESFDEAAWGPFAARLHYLEGDFAVNEESGRLARRLAEIGGDGGSSNLLFYLATPPQAYTPLVDALAAVGLTVERDGWRRVVIEKPFGSDLETARQLNAALHRHLRIAAAVHRQLALAWRPVLPALRQEPGGQDDAGLDPVQVRAALDVPPAVRPDHPTERALHLPAARRGDPPALRGQSSRQPAPVPLGRHGIPLRRGFRTAGHPRGL